MEVTEKNTNLDPRQQCRKTVNISQLHVLLSRSFLQTLDRFSSFFLCWCSCKLLYHRCTICRSNVSFLVILVMALIWNKKCGAWQERQENVLLSNWLTASETKSTQWPSMLEGPICYRKLMSSIAFSIIRLQTLNSINMQTIIVDKRCSAPLYLSPLININIILQVIPLFQFATLQ
jgi:hypothetical protein